MATPANRLIRDQNLNIYSTGALLGGKVDSNWAIKKGALGERRALNDISNSKNVRAVGKDLVGRRALNDISNSKSVSATGKDLVGRRALNDISNSKNVGAVGKDLVGRRALNDISNSKNVSAVGKDLGAAKLDSLMNLEKGKVSRRKALSDLTNTVNKPSHQNAHGRNQGKKISAIAEESAPFSFKDEGFLHNHEECLKAQRNTMDYDYFMETIGLANESSLVLHKLRQLKAKSPVKLLEEMEDMPMVLSEDDDDMKLNWQPELPDSPIWEPLNYCYWKDDDFLDFKLLESPKVKKFYAC